MHLATSMVMLVLIAAGTTPVIVIVFVMIIIIILEMTIRMINTDTNTDSNGSRRNSTWTSTLPAGGVMQSLGLWGDVSHLLQEKRETVFLVVKSYKMWVSGRASIHIYIYMRSLYISIAVHSFPNILVV